MHESPALFTKTSSPLIPVTGNYVKQQTPTRFELENKNRKNLQTGRRKHQYRYCSLQPSSRACMCQTLQETPAVIFTSSIFFSFPKAWQPVFTQSPAPKNNLPSLFSLWRWEQVLLGGVPGLLVFLIRRPREREFLFFLVSLMVVYEWRWSAEASFESAVHHAVGKHGACQENAHNTGDRAEERIF